MPNQETPKNLQYDTWRNALAYHVARYIINQQALTFEEVYQATREAMESPGYLLTEQQAMQDSSETETVKVDARFGRPPVYYEGQKAVPAPLTVSSPHGYATLGADGTIVTMEHTFAEEYGNLKKFDIEEYREFYKGSGVENANCFDILDLGCWLDTGGYEPPEVDWRRDTVWNHICNHLYEDHMITLTAADREKFDLNNPRYVQQCTDYLKKEINK